MSTLSGLLIIAAFAFLWVNSTRARERAIAACIEGCRRRDVQLLDQTVELASLRPATGFGRLQLRRVYRFEFSEQGVERYTGHVVLVGLHLTDFSLGLPDVEDSEESNGPAAASEENGQQEDPVEPDPPRLH